MKITIIEKPYSNDWFLHKITDAFNEFDHSHKTYSHRKKMFTVLVGLCRLAYQKGLSDGKS